ncbi:MAG: nucleotidyltransferase family protein [Magnetococcus sp. DMHC-6]
MNVMILAAGRGERLRPLTDLLPKPLVEVAGLPVIEHTLRRLTTLGVDLVVINVCYLADKMIEYIGDGSAWGLRVVWSREQRLLETGGGVRQALGLLGSEPFLVINGDVLWDLNLKLFLAQFDGERMDGLLGLVANPVWKKGDFVLNQEGRLARYRGEGVGWTYSGIQILTPNMFASHTQEAFSLNALYDTSLLMGRLYGSVLTGFWSDIGQLDRLEQARKEWPEYQREFTSNG